MSALDMFPEVVSEIVPSGETDSWFTPLAQFEEWNLLGRFTLDVAGHPDAPVSRRIGRFLTEADNGLAQSWVGERVWCNCPYSDITPWVRKAAADIMINTAGPELVALLLPAWTDRKWWHAHIEPWRDEGWCSGSGNWEFSVRVDFLPGRMKFGHPNDPEARLKGAQAASFPSALITMSRRST